MDYFPLGLAKGQAFCNRSEEQANLFLNIEQSRPTLIISPRRYGKTSLSLHVINKSKLGYAHFDFLSAISESDIERILFKGVGELLSRLDKSPTKLLKIATDFFSGLSIKLSFDSIGLQVEINRKTVNSSNTILDVLQRLEKLSKKYKKKIVLLFDEFQRVYQVTDNQSIEGVLRQVAQASEHLSFIFSGSNRHLLHKVFDDRNRPFYKLCDRITLDRIHSEEYMKYFSKASKSTRDLNITDAAFEAILFHTERHPYYVNLLCSRLWKLTTVTESTVNASWNNYCFEERSQVANELDLLSASQRKLIITLARCDGTSAPRSIEFENIAGIPGATITQAMNLLEKRDYVYRDKKNKIMVLDPLIKTVVKEF